MTLIDKLTQTLLYEGYLLYPYRANAVKNQQRFTFGTLYPQSYCQNSTGADSSWHQAEFLVHCEGAPRVETRVRFLQLTSRIIQRVDVPKGLAAPHFTPVESLTLIGETHQSWQEAVEREITLPPLSLVPGTEPSRQECAFPESETSEPLLSAEGQVVGRIVRRQHALQGMVQLSATQIEDRLWRVRVRVSNETMFDAAKTLTQDEANLSSLASAHSISTVHDGKFISLFDPPDHYREAVSACQNKGVWPVLVGQPPSQDTMLASPIILYDYPQIAQESPGDLCDGTEIDEILMLRIMTLSDEEKREMRSLDPRSREMLDRTELLPQEQFMKMHGAIRGLRPVRETN